MSYEQTLKPKPQNPSYISEQPYITTLSPKKPWPRCLNLESSFLRFEALDRACLRKEDFEQFFERYLSFLRASAAGGNSQVRSQVMEESRKWNGNRDCT